MDKALHQPAFNESAHTTSRYEHPADAQLVDHLGWSQLAEHAAGVMTVMVPDIVPANAETQEKSVFVVDDLFAVRDLLAAQVSNSRG